MRSLLDLAPHHENTTGPGPTQRITTETWPHTTRSTTDLAHNAMRTLLELAPHTRDHYWTWPPYHEITIGPGPTPRDHYWTWPHTMRSLLDLAQHHEITTGPGPTPRDHYWTWPHTMRTLLDLVPHHENTTGPGPTP